MVERIRKLLETRQLTPTQFADAIGIARPIVSHILSGRNKPSLEVVQRILAAMPDLSMPWLLNGTGPMLAYAVLPPPAASQQPEAPAIGSEPEPKTRLAVAPANLAAAPPAGVPTEGGGNTAAQISLPGPARTAVAGAVPKRFAPLALRPKPAPVGPSEPTAASADAAAPSTPLKPGSKTAEASVAVPVSSAPEAVAVEPGANEGGGPAAALFAGTEKPIRRIVIFYRDGSFTDYQPE